MRAVSQEIARGLVGGQVQHVAQPAGEDLVLTVRNRGANHLLLLSCHAEFARAHLTVAKRPNPSSPPTFCMACRKYLEGGHVVSVTQRDFDRILDVRIAGSGGEEYLLVAELMGKHSNLILVSESGVILDAAKRIPGRRSRYREVLPGIPYLAPPPQPERLDLFAATEEVIAEVSANAPADPEALSARLMSHFAGLSPFLAMELALRAEGKPTSAEEPRSRGAEEQTPNPESDPGVFASLRELPPLTPDAQGPTPSLWSAWQQVFGEAAAGQWTPILIRNERGESVGAYPIRTVQWPADLQHGRDSINTALDQHYLAAIPRAARDAARRELESALTRVIRSCRARLADLRKGLAEAGKADAHREAGELILANLHCIAPKAESAEVPDLYAGGNTVRRIPLDGRLSPQENAEAYFRRYRKARDSAAVLADLAANTEADLAALESAAESAREIEDAAALRALQADLTARGLLRHGPTEQTAPAAKQAPGFGGKRIRRVTTPDGWEILVGESAEANDYLTTRVASPSDLWFHVRGGTSAHVVIRTRNNPTSVPQQVLKQAALLAAQHSAQKHSSTVAVDYTLRKHVRRPRGAQPGTVLYQNEKTIHVSPKG